MSASIAFRGINKTYQTKQGITPALQSFNLEIAQNNFVALVGPSGCGKSTVLHIAAGLDTQYQGECLVSPVNCQRAYLFQAPRLLPWLTVAQNVSFIHEARSTSRRQAMQIAHHYLELVGLTEFAQSYPGHLSGGMQQRVALARALSIRPDVMFMDEPFASLDELTARKMRAQLLRLHADMPHTVLFVTHNISEAVFLADRVGILSQHPGHLLTEIAVDVPRPREYDDPVLAVLAQQIFHQLSQEEVLM